jgi:hypothetical protein
MERHQGFMGSMREWVRGILSPRCVARGRDLTISKEFAIKRDAPPPRLEDMVFAQKRIEVIICPPALVILKDFAGKKRVLVAV